MEGGSENEAGAKPRAQVYNTDSSSVTFGEKAGPPINDHGANQLCAASQVLRQSPCLRGVGLNFLTTVVRVAVWAILVL